MADWSIKASEHWREFAQDRTNWENTEQAGNMRSQITSLANQGSGKRNEELKTRYARFLVQFDGQEIVDIEQTWKSGVWLGEDSEET